VRPGGPLNVVEAYSPLTNTWTTVAPLPAPRGQVNATTSRDGLIYVIGGCEAKPSLGCPTTKRVDVYSPQQNKWWTVPPTQEFHLGGAAATGRNRIFAIGPGFVESRPSFCQTCQ
jgi:hypothetical protein